MPSVTAVWWSEGGELRLGVSQALLTPVRGVRAQECAPAQQHRNPLVLERAQRSLPGDRAPIVWSATRSLHRPGNLPSESLPVHSPVSLGLDSSFKGTKAQHKQGYLWFSSYMQGYDMCPTLPLEMWMFRVLLGLCPGVERGILAVLGNGCK